MRKKDIVLLAQIVYGIMWRSAIVMFALIGFADWYFKMKG